MCGIIGYVGNSLALPVLMQGLERLEYRGYDSAGVCVQHDNALHIYKRRGQVAELAASLPPFQGTIGIAHTRWATHGEPSEANAHPHVDCTRRIAIAHNGIIENHHALRALLEQEGHAFTSATDSEIIAHLVEKFYAGNLEEAVIKAVLLLEGTFGLAVMHEAERSIVVVRRGSPLILGVAEEGMLVGSDVAAMLAYTRRVVYLNDDELAVLTDKGYTLRNIHGKTVVNNIHDIKWTLDAIERSGYKHFMLKEIFEQPTAVENTLRGRITRGRIKLTLDLPDSIKRIVILGCGTSWHAALIGKHFIEQFTDIPVEVDYASEFRYRPNNLSADDVVVVISQSGETADTLAALRHATPATTVGIINVVGSTIAREVQSGIFLHAGPEIGVASTKAFTCQVTALLLLALYLRQRTNSLDKQLIDSLIDVPELIRKTLDQAASLRDIAAHFVESKNFLYLGRGVNFPVALEGALKLKEISYIHAEGYPAAEMKHGPIALIDEHMPVVFVSPHDRLYEKVMSNMQEIKARKGTIIVITTTQDPAIKQLADYVCVIPAVREELSPIITSIPLQLLAYYIADLKGLNVDKPRNLAKSVTVE